MQSKKAARYNPFMSLSIQDARHIADLANISVSDAELEQYRHQLESILDHIARLREVDTENISPTSTILPPRSVLRDDQARPSLTVEEALTNAPLADREMFHIPPVFEK
jgi:aspartyl-tRNA(Asn)/glutamyl-tRNA(Gln) amidotransferase subunit C